MTARRNWPPRTRLNTINELLDRFPYRGNASRVKLWRNTDGAMLTTTYNYDDLGNVRSIKDQHGNTSSYAYNDSWRTARATRPAMAGICHSVHKRIEPERHLRLLPLLGPSAGEKGPKRYQCWPIAQRTAMTCLAHPE